MTATEFNNEAKPLRAVSRVMGVRRSLLEALVEDGKLPAYRIGSRILVRAADVGPAIEAARIRPAAKPTA